MSLCTVKLDKTKVSLTKDEMISAMMSFIRPANFLATCVKRANGRMFKVIIDTDATDAECEMFMSDKLGKAIIEYLSSTKIIDNESGTPCFPPTEMVRKIYQPGHEEHDRELSLFPNDKIGKILAFEVKE